MSNGKIFGKLDNPPKYTKSKRLEKSKEDKFLTKRIFDRLSENMHYEIFKFMNSSDLLQIRASKLGGYQLTSNTKLRSRIKNYIREFIVSPTLLTSQRCLESIQVIFEQIGKNKLTFEGMRMEDKGLIYLSKILRQINTITEINLKDNLIKKRGIFAFAESLKFTPDLETIWLCENQIHASGISYFSEYLKYIPKLKSLSLRENKLTTGIQDLAEKFKFIPNMNYLDLSSTAIRTESSSVFLNLKYLSNLTILNMSHNEIGVAGLQCLAQNISYLGKLEYLNLNLTTFTHNAFGIGISGMHYVFKELKFLPFLKTLCLRCNTLKTIDAETLAINLQYIPKIEKIDLGQNDIGSQGIKVIGENLKFIPNLRDFDLGMTLKRQNDGIQKFAENIKLLTRIQILNFSSSMIGEIAGQLLAINLKFLPKLRELSLNDCSIGDSSTIILGENLKYIVSLTLLRIGKNEIGLRGAESLAKNLKHIRKLEILEIRENIFKGGIIRIFNELKCIPDLKLFDFGRNKLGFEDAKALAESFQYIGKLETLLLEYTTLKPDGINCLTEKFINLSNLTTLDLKGNLGGQDGIKDLSRRLPHIPKLQRLILRLVNCGDKGSELLANNLKWIPNIQEIDLRFAHVGKLGVKALTKNLVFTPQLKIIDLRDNMTNRSYRDFQTFRTFANARGIEVYISQLNLQRNI